MSVSDSDSAAFYAKLAREYEYYSTGRNGWICVRFGTGGTRVTKMR